MSFHSLSCMFLFPELLFYLHLCFKSLMMLMKHASDCMLMHPDATSSCPNVRGGNSSSISLCMMIRYCAVIELEIQVCIQKFPDWPPRARTANGTALCHQLQLYHYFVNHSSEFFCHNPLCCFSVSVYCYFVIGSVQKLFDTPSYM
jgi:hypothetical protein